MKRIWIWLSLATFLISAAECLAAPLFVVDRTTNANRLVYEADFDHLEPVRAHWEMRADRGQIENLTPLERTQVYGVKILRRERTEIDFSFRALPEVTFFVAEENGQPVARVELLGERRPVQKIFLHLSGGLFPRVNAIDFEIRGTTPEKISLVHEGGSRWREQREGN